MKKFFILFFLVLSYLVFSAEIRTNNIVSSGNEITVPNFKIDYVSYNNNITKNDVVNYKMSNEQKANIFFWLWVGGAIGMGVGLLMIIPGGILMGVSSSIMTGYAVGTRTYAEYVNASNMYSGGTYLFGTGMFFFVHGVGAFVAGMVLWIIFKNKSSGGKKSEITPIQTIYDQKVSFDVIGTNDSIGGFFTIRFN